MNWHIDAIINMPGSGQYFPNPDPTRWVPSAALGGPPVVDGGTLQCYENPNEESIGVLRTGEQLRDPLSNLLPFLLLPLPNVKRQRNAH